MLPLQLEMMADLASSTTEKQQFRQRSYKKSAGMVRKMREIPKEVRHKNLCAVNGIGDKTAAKIIEIARTGKENGSLGAVRYVRMCTS